MAYSKEELLDMSKDMFQNNIGNNWEKILTALANLYDDLDVYQIAMAVTQMPGCTYVKTRREWEVIEGAQVAALPSDAIFIYDDGADSVESYYDFSQTLYADGKMSGMVHPVVSFGQGGLSVDARKTQNEQTLKKIIVSYLMNNKELGARATEDLDHAVKSLYETELLDGRENSQFYEKAVKAALCFCLRVRCGCNADFANYKSTLSKLPFTLKYKAACEVRQCLIEIERIIDDWFDDESEDDEY